MIRLGHPTPSARMAIAASLLLAPFPAACSRPPDEPPALDITIATANLSNNTSQTYEDPGIRILQALRPDILAIQEFRCPSGSPEDLARRLFGPDVHFHREKGARLPNGIISRFPILAAGQWHDPHVRNRDFAWATLDIPGPKPLHVVSVHLLQTRAADRPPQARLLLDLIRRHFPATDYVVLCGDLNISSRRAEAFTVLAAELDDSRQPVDQNGNPNTNAERNRPYDVVLPNPELAQHHAPTRLGSLVFPDGLVFDTRLWDPPPPPAEWGDTARDMQHLPVMKTFRIPLAVPGTTAP
ncbi:MAG: endonuclease/exonuclease/phosphatase family protein [Lentisphaerae bacterium]|nr:endonuclease/exonuclease/phosphatase family protein [Lentisphaerota bacterium]